MDAAKSQSLPASRRNRESGELAQRNRDWGFLELREYSAGREHGLEQLARYSQYWQHPLAERREQTSNLSIELVFFRIDIKSMSGLRATE